MAKKAEKPAGTEMVVDPETTRSRRLSLVGRVLGADRAPVANALVRLASYPPEFGKRVDVRRQVNRSAGQMVLRPIEETVTARDGIFLFTGLPAGQYAVEARAPGSAKEFQAGKPVEVGAGDGKGAPVSIEIQMGSGGKQTAPEK
jgi:hypothetical protein